MLLVDALVHGFRRFGGEIPHKLLVDARMVCLIGANEAGKSSVLKLLAEAHDAESIPRGDRTRREQVPDEREVLVLHYRLDAADQAAVADLYGEQPLPQWFTVKKTASGSVQREPDRGPKRDRRARTAARRALEDDAVRIRLTTTTDSEDPDEVVVAVIDPSELAAILETLSDDPANLGEEEIERLDTFAITLREADELALAELVEGAAQFERTPHPSSVARQRLWRRTPDFVFFSQEERQLGPEYDLVEVAADPPVALANLARLAELDLAELLATIQAHETGTVEHLERLANSRLATVFAAWSQEPKIEVTINLSGTLLLIHVTTGTDIPMRLDERSDGLRQFVALVAASAQDDEHGPPILLIDEIETHLHYDAQADLLSILADQTQARGGSSPPIGQVIYTTHSSACLPDDLGSVRVVEADAQYTRSTVRNQFWTDDPGLGPLLMAMGAATLAFVPRRSALVAEGPSELILLPTLIKQAANIEHLGYQIAPGASSARPGSIVGLDLAAPRTVWVVDSDKGGAEIAAKLEADGIDPALVVTLGEAGAGLQLENLVEVEAYRDAVAAYLADKRSEAAPPSVAELVGDRARAVEAHCERLAVRPPSKVVIANKLLAMRAEREIIAEEHRQTLRELHAQVLKLLET